MGHNYFKLTNLHQLFILVRVNSKLPISSSPSWSPQGHSSATEEFFLSLAYTSAFFLARSSLWQMHCLSFYSKQFTPEFPASKRANYLSRSASLIATKKSAGPLRAPWDILGCCTVPAKVTYSSDKPLKCHQDYPGYLKQNQMPLTVQLNLTKDSHPIPSK